MSDGYSIVLLFGGFSLTAVKNSTFYLWLFCEKKIKSASINLHPHKKRGLWKSLVRTRLQEALLGQFENWICVHRIHSNCQLRKAHFNAFYTLWLNFTWWLTSHWDTRHKLSPGSSGNDLVQAVSSSFLVCSYTSSCQGLLWLQVCCVQPSQQHRFRKHHYLHTGIRYYIIWMEQKT